MFLSSYRTTFLYIHFYKHKRFQKKLNNLSPVEYRTKVA
ncbi:MULTISPECIES: IS3 family transposase [unclassified Paenibacillus]